METLSLNDDKSSSSVLDLILTKIKLSNITFILYFSFPIVLRAIMKIVNIFYKTDSVMAPLSILFFFILMTVLLNRNNNIYDFAILFIGIILSFLVTYAIYPEYKEWLFSDNWGIINRIFRIDRGIYAYLIVRLVKKPEDMLENLKMVAILNFILGIYQVLKMSQMGHWLIIAADGVTEVESAYNMSFGYSMSFVAIVFMHFAFKEKKRLYYILSAISIGAIFLWGSRGPLMSIGIYLILIYLTKDRKLTLSHIIKFIIMVTIVSLLIFNFVKIVSVIETVLSKVGIHSRNISMLLDGSIAEDTARGKIFKLVMPMVKEKFPLGYGAYGDRHIVSGNFPWGYSHNIILELIISFGILGVVLIGYLAFYSVKMIFTSEDDDWKWLFIIFFACSSKLLISDSFWFLSYFWAAIAVVVNYRKGKKRIVKS